MGEWENRELCPDGGCIGVIGKAGTCTVCGKKGSGKAASAAGPESESASTPYDSDESAESDEEAAPASAPEPAPRDSALGGSEWDQRKLCPDGSCVGVIGAKGRCSVCGRAGI